MAGIGGWRRGGMAGAFAGKRGLRRGGRGEDVIELHRRRRGRVLGGRQLAEQGGATLSLSVADLMTRKVVTCAPDERIIQVLQKMTDGRFRHVPVIADGALIGLVSIGDLVNHRLRELEYEALKMKQMIVG